MSESTRLTSSTSSSTGSPAAAAAMMPASDVSGAVGLVGLVGLVVWIIFCRSYPEIAAMLGIGGEFSGERGVLSGANAALAGLLFSAVPMALWSVLVDKVHLRPSTGLDWSHKRPLADVLPISAIKIAGLWATWGVLAAFYALCRWYWNGQYLFAMDVLKYAALPLVVLSVPYVIWLDRHLVDQRDGAWHVGALLVGHGDWEGAAIARHARAWAIKGFFGAFMISILPFGFAEVVEADLAQITANPVDLAMKLIALMFVVDVQIGTVGYLVTMRPLDAHIRSGNPFVAGWLAALICYPPFVWGVIGGDGQILSYEVATAGWAYWLAQQPALLWGWAALLVALTGVYAWATVIFGIRFSNLTYRGVLTNGPYRFTRHPAYLSKNLFWWASVMPFLVTNGSGADAIRNCCFLLIVNGIYYWRARTEEAHLLAEDAKYRDYHAWMAQHGLVTAPLARLGHAIFGRRGALADPSAAYPAE